MQKTKLAFVTLLSLLVVLVPVSTALAATEKVGGSVNQTSGKKATEENSKRGSVFQEIEQQGGKSVSEENLKEIEGEFWGVVSAAAAGGAIVSSSYYAGTYALGKHAWDWGKFTSKTIGSAAGAAAGAATGSISAGKACAAAASAVGSFVGNAVGDIIGGLW
ncbi:hypothetical protein KGY79_08255 [Candidatus Bipolaricaulota bacterium]|nr:hypothetical protein [Candidatus Bipolaricaulota bacterium]